MRHRVLVVSARMGAGHDGAARELARRLREQGHEVEIRDFLDALPWPLGPLLRAGYEFQIRHLAWSYELTYRFWCWLPLLVAPLAWFISVLARRKIRGWAAGCDADVVVSVYPLASQALGVMRRKGQLRVPAATFLTDFAVHPVWVHAGVDLHLAVHPTSAAEAERRGSGRALAPGPLVGPAFARPINRAAARAALGLGDDDRAVLIVAGSWGVGAVAATYTLIARSGRYVPIAVCGRDERLRGRLQRLGVGRVIGWTDEMPSLMAAADALVENAGGLTSMEALVAGLPVVSFRPIAGHGRANTARMHAAGVARRADTPEQLLSALEALTSPGVDRARARRAGRAVVAGDAAVDVVELATAAHLVREPSAGRVRRPRSAIGTAARVAAVAGAMVTLPIGIDAGFSVATAYGVGVAHAPAPAADVAYVAVRLDASAIDDSAVVAHVERLHATVVVDEQTVAQSPAAVRSLSEQGIDIANGGTGHHIGLPWRRVDLDVVQSGRLLRQTTGMPDAAFVPDRHVDAVDLVTCRRLHSRVVVPNRELSAGTTLAHTYARHTYLVDGAAATPAQIDKTLETVGDALNAANLRGAPYSQMR